MTAVYDVDGTKNYQVRFSVPDYNMYIEGVVPASLVEVDKVIDDKNKSMKFVVVKPYVNFKNIDDVVVIEPRNIG